MALGNQRACWWLRAKQWQHSERIGLMHSEKAGFLSCGVVISHLVNEMKKKKKCCCGEKVKFWGKTTQGSDCPLNSTYKDDYWAQWAELRSSPWGWNRPTSHFGNRSSWPRGRGSIAGGKSPPAAACGVCAGELGPGADIRHDTLHRSVRREI